MKNIYNITKGQLITLNLAGILGWLWYNQELGGGFFTFFIPFALTFYYLGYRNFKKNDLTK